MTKKILIATPVYRETVPDFTASLMATIHLLNKNGFVVKWAPAVGCCYVHTSRNRLTQAFRDSDFTDILWWDSDIGADPEDVLRLLSHDREIVGGAAPFRFGGIDGFPAIMKRDKDGYAIGLADEGLVAAKIVPTAMLKVHRSVFDKIETLGMARLLIEYVGDPPKETGRWRSFFDFEYDELRHIEYGEDVTFCRKCERAGFQMWIEPNMTIRHHGNSFNTGNLKQFNERV